MKFKKKKRYKKYDRSEADIIAGKKMIDDYMHGVNLPLKHYYNISDFLCRETGKYKDNK